MPEVGTVVFDENQGYDPLPIPRPEPPGLGKTILKMGIVSTPGDAAIVLALFASFLIIGSIYMIVSSIPQEVVLGSDVLREGEAVPVYSAPR